MDTDNDVLEPEYCFIAMRGYVQINSKKNIALLKENLRAADNILFLEYFSNEENNR